MSTAKKAVYARFKIDLFDQTDFSGGSMKRLKHRSAQSGASDHAGRKGARPLRSVLASLCAVAMSLGMASASVAAFADDRRQELQDKVDEQQDKLDAINQQIAPKPQPRVLGTWTLHSTPSESPRTMTGHTR